MHSSLNSNTESRRHRSSGPRAKMLPELIGEEQREVAQENRQEVVGEAGEESHSIGEPSSKVIPSENPVQGRIAIALSADIPKLYANSFAIVMGKADSILVLEQNGKPIAVLNLSFTSAKSLAMKLGTLISNLEENFGRAIMTTDDIERMFTPGRQS